MPRRSIERSVPGTGNVIDMKTGKTVKKPALPVVCERVRFFRERMGIEQKELAKMIGVTGNAVSNWENGRGRPDLNLIPELCEALHITMYDLFGLKDPTEQYTAGEQMHIEQYRELTYFSRSLAAGFGDPTEFEDEGEPIWLYASREVDRADCVFTVNGNSMEPAYHDGDMVLVSRIPDAPDLQPGEVGAFITGNETYIKVYQEDGLHSMNPDYKPIHFNETDRVYLIGRVTGILDPGQVASESDVNKYQMLHPEDH